MGVCKDAPRSAETGCYMECSTKGCRLYLQTRTPSLCLGYRLFLHSAFCLVWPPYPNQIATLPGIPDQTEQTRPRDSQYTRKSPKSMPQGDPELNRRLRPRARQTRKRTASSAFLEVQGSYDGSLYGIYYMVFVYIYVYLRIYDGLECKVYNTWYMVYTLGGPG